MVFLLFLGILTFIGIATFLYAIIVAPMYPDDYDTT